MPPKARQTANTAKRKAPQNTQLTTGLLIPAIAFVPVDGVIATEAPTKRKRVENDDGGSSTKKKEKAQKASPKQNSEQLAAKANIPRRPMAPLRFKRKNPVQEYNEFKDEADLLREHMEPLFERNRSGRPVSLKHYPVFKLQKTPKSISGGARCRLQKCGDVISVGDHRIALEPGMTPGREMFNWYYHVHCFENLLDLSSPHYAARFEPDREEYPPDGIAEAILESYIDQWRFRLSATELTSNKDWALADRMHEQSRDWLEQEYSRSVDRYQFDPDDQYYGKEWHPNQYFLPETHPQYNERHALSQALEAYDEDGRNDTYEEYDHWRDD